MDVGVGLQRKLSAEELILWERGVGEDLSPLNSKEIKPVTLKGTQP